MDMDLVPTLLNNSDPQFYQPETMEDVVSFEKQLADVLLGEDFSYPLSVESNTTFLPHWDIGYDLLDQIITTPPSCGSHNYDNNNNKVNDNNNDDDDNKNDHDSVETLEGSGVVEEPRRSKKRKEETEKQAVSSGGRPKRKRQPTQVYDHILAERKRREVLSHMFISLSSMIPGLKKMDKTTILGDAIKHMKQLQEKVKELEVAAAQHNTTKSKVVVKKYKLPMNDGNDDDNDDNGCSFTLVDDNIGASGGSGGSDANDGSDNNNNNNNNNNNADNKNSVLDIEVKISDNTLLLKVYCEKRKGIISELIAVVDRHGLSITNCGVIPFQNLTLDITIVAQMEEGFNNNVKGLVRSVRSALGSIASE